MSERDKAFMDAVFHGNGFLVTGADGVERRIDPADVKIAPAPTITDEQVEKATNVLRSFLVLAERPDREHIVPHAVRRALEAALLP